MSNSLRSNGLRFVRGGVALVLLGAFAMGHASDELAPAPQPKPRYAPGVLIVKFKEPVADELKAALVRGEPLHQVSLTPSLDTLNAKYGLKKMRMLFQSFQVMDANGAVLRVETMEEHAERIRERFPVRAARGTGACRGPDLTRCFRLELDESANMQPAAGDYGANPDVQDAQLDYLVEACPWDPNDFYYNTPVPGSWGQDYDDLWGIKKIGCRYAWYYTKGAGVTIAVIDTGIDYRKKDPEDPEDTGGHPDIVPNLWMNYYEYYGYPDYDDDYNGYIDDIWGWNFVEPKSEEHPDEPYSDEEDSEDTDPMDFLGHGTHVAGTAAAVGNNQTAVVGVSPQARVMTLKSLNRNGLGLHSWSAEAIQYAADNGADVLNCSFGGGVDHWAQRQAVTYAWQLGCVVVCAAGNSNSDVACHFPAAYRRTIAVAATDHEDVKSGFSNWGTGIDVAAPGGHSRSNSGRDVLSLRAQDTHMSSPRYIVDAEGLGNGRDCYRARGTSMACPHVAGVAALFLSTNPSAYSNEEVRQAIRRSAVDLGAEARDDLYGYGRLDAAAMVTAGHQCEALILQPEESQSLQRGYEEPVLVQGIADGLYFQHWRTEYSLDGIEPQWALLAEGSEPLPRPWGDSMGWTYFDDIPGGQYIIRLTVENAWGVQHFDYLSFLIYAGICEWAYYSVRSSPLIAELDPSRPGHEFVFSFNNIRTYPETDPRIGLRAFYSDGNPYWITGDVGLTDSSPVCAELCSHPGPEIIVASPAAGGRKVQALHSDGSICWQFPICGWPLGLTKISPAVAELVEGEHSGPEVVFADGDGTVYCLFGDACGQQPSVAWQFTTDGPTCVDSCVAIDDIDPGSPGLEVAFGDLGGNVYVLSSQGGKLHRFSMGSGTWMGCAPALANLDTNYADLEIVVGADDGCLYAFCVSCPDEPLWSYDTGAPVRSSPAIADLDPYVPGFEVLALSDSGNLHCLHHDGTPAWTFDTGTSLAALGHNRRPCPAVADLYPSDAAPEVSVGSLSGKVYLLHGQDGSPCWCFSTDPGVWSHANHSSPVIGDIRPDLYGLEMVIAPDDGQIYVFHFPGTAAGRMPWPMFQHDAQHTGRYDPES